MSEKKIRITKSQRFEDIKALLNGQPVTYGTTAEIAVEVLDHEIALLAKKNSSDSKKMTKAQEENEGYKELIVEYLAGLADDHEGMTCAAIGKAIPELNDFTTQKISALMRQLKTAQRVTTNEKKGKTLFRLA